MYLSEILKRISPHLQQSRSFRLSGNHSMFRSPPSSPILILRYICLHLEMYFSEFWNLSLFVTKQGLWAEWQSLNIQVSSFPSPFPSFPLAQLLIGFLILLENAFSSSWNLWLQQFGKYAILKFTFLHSSTLNPAILEIPPSSMLVHFDGFVNAPVWDNMHFSNIHLPLSRSRRICTKENVPKEKKKEKRKMTNFSWADTHRPLCENLKVSFFNYI